MRDANVVMAERGLVDAKLHYKRWSDELYVRRKALGAAKQAKWKGAIRTWSYEVEVAEQQVVRALEAWSGWQRVYDAAAKRAVLREKAAAKAGASKAPASRVEAA